MPDPEISVVIPTYNRWPLLKEAIESVRAQTYQDFEIIVIDDGSTDGTGERVLAAYADDPRVRYFHQPNRGPSAARNIGIAQARGHLLALLDSDDAWLPTKLERQLEILRTDRSVGVVYCKFAFMDELGDRLDQPWPRPPVRGDLYVDLMYSNVVYGSDSAVLMRTADMREAGGFDESLFAAEDHDLWRRLALRHRFVCLDEVLVLVRMHSSSIQRDVSRMAEGALRHLAKILAETPQNHRHHLHAVCEALSADYTRRFMAQHKYVAALLFNARLAYQGGAQARGAVRSIFWRWLRARPEVVLEWLFSTYRRLPEPVKNVWRSLKGTMPRR